MDNIKEATRIGKEASPCEVLDDLVAAQQREVGYWEFPLGLLQQNKEFLEGYLPTLLFSSTYKEACEALSSDRSEENQSPKDFRRILAGRVVNDLALLYLTFTHPSQVILSPGRTLEFYRFLYPFAKSAPHILGLDSLHGISVPDGLITGNGKILTVCQYTTGRYEKKYPLGFHLDKERFPELFDEAKLVIFAPENKELPYSSGEDNDVQLARLPFTNKELRELINLIYYSFRSEEGRLTLAEAYKIETNSQQNPH